MRNLMVDMDSIISQAGKLDMLEVMLAAGSITFRKVNDIYCVVWTFQGATLCANSDTVSGLVDGLYIELIKLRDLLRASNEG